MENYSQLSHLTSQPLKIFGIGLNRTGTTSLTFALNKLGMKLVRCPDEQTIFKELMVGNYKLSILNEFDGITAVVAAPFFAQWDLMYPESKFILTLRDKESWLNSIETHWQRKPVRQESGHNPKMLLRSLQRVAIFGTYQFNRERLSYIYDLHYKMVREYFKDRPESLLEIDICGGEGWEKLCPFFDLPVLDQAFPSKNGKKLVGSISQK